jgi:hypothetical protein
MPDRKKDSPPSHQVEFLMSPLEHRAEAHKLSQQRDNDLAQFLAQHHRHLAHHIQQEINAGRARVRPRNP